MTTHALAQGLLCFQQPRFMDSRGYFTELHRQNHPQDLLKNQAFVQDNLSVSIKGTLRGLHYQTGAHKQSKLVIPIQGDIFDVVVDCRRGSDTFGRWYGFHLSAEKGDQLFVPGECAHGFLVTTDIAIVMYKCSTEYNPSAEASIHWNDPDLAIEWPLPSGKSPLVSEKDDIAGSWKTAITFE